MMMKMEWDRSGACGARLKGRLRCRHMARPVGVMVSMASVREWNFTPAGAEVIQHRYQVAVTKKTKMVTGDRSA